MSVLLTEDANESYERILLNCNGLSELPTGFNHPNLSVLLLSAGDEHLKFPRDFYERMKKLEVVSYESMRTPLLPLTFENATKLRTLCLRSCQLMHDLSFLGSLSNLEILSFADCGIRKLPLTIRELKRLKLLDLRGCCDLRIDDGVFINLVSLQELYMRAYGRYSIKFTDKNCDELRILSSRLHALELEFFENAAQPKNVSFEKLKRFKISIGCALEIEYREPFSFENTLKLVINCNELLECNISGLFDKTEKLHLQVNDMYSIANVSMHHSFSNLSVLKVDKCAELTYLFTIPVANGLKKLKHLTVSKCPVLKALVGGENSGVGVSKFPELRFMNLSGLPKLISIYPDNNNTSSTQSLLSKEVVMPTLEELEVSDMESLKQIWPCQMTTSEKKNVCMLRKIEVYDCDNLVNLFPRNPLPLVNHLEELTVRSCGSIEVLFNLDLEDVCEMEEFSSRLRKIEVEGLEELGELWRMKGLNNSHIIINGFKGVQSLNIRGCYKYKYIYTPTTANFDLGALTSYSANNYDWNSATRRENKLIERSQEINVISEGVIPEIDDNIPNFTYSSNLLCTCHHLQKLELSGDKRVDVVFEMDSPSSISQLSTNRDNQQPLLLHPYVEDLKLSFLENMSHVWKCHWNKFLISQQSPLEFPFHNLTTIYLRHCHKIKYLLSPLMGKFLSNLKHVQIESCHSIEEIISSRDDEKATSTSTFTSSHTNTTLFPHLDTLHLHDHVQASEVIGASWSLCQYLKKINVEDCHALSSLLPWYTVGQLKNLEELSISSCGTMMEVFQSQTVNNSTKLDDHGSASGGTTLTSSRLKSVTAVPQLSNLKVVVMSKCGLLRHVFTFSTLKSLKKLKELRVDSCPTTEVIVKEEDGEQTTTSKVVDFPCLETLQLVNLANLEGFFLGMNHVFQWPLLDNVMISDCPKMIVFTSGRSKTPKLKYVYTKLGKHSLECGLNIHGMTDQHDHDHDQTVTPNSDHTTSNGLPFSFHNLIELKVEKNDGETIIPFHALPQLQKLEKICLRNNHLIEEVFEGTNNSGSQTLVKIPNLTELTLESLYKLKYIWKRTQWMVLEFPMLTTLHIHYCPNLEYVFTCSMVGSLKHLQHLQIVRCDYIKVIVKEEEEEESDGKVNENNLPCLKSIKLIGLKSLAGFCLGKDAFSLPLLDTLRIEWCPFLTTFTSGHLDTPELKQIITSSGICEVMGDLNSTIKTY